ncbi:unnamed protein product [Moneuplotes crassus]|uniref:AP2/ERF domain-containing protein n=1 Tax=Euplotes crassus TaxID=5936 RepID=A0AAD1XN15_EUPCR|nr:unnamed protein product [Moneuplotes crassus]
MIQELSSVYCIGPLQQKVLRRQDCCVCSSLGLLSITCAKCSVDKSCTKMSDKKTSHHENSISLNSHEFESQHKQSICLSKIFGKRKRKTPELDLRKSLLKLRNLILNRFVTGFASTRKKARTANKKQLRRRSRYIGVSRNNDNWQALINVDQVKNYIGTFTDELEAAKAYDLYSVAIRGQGAALNFDYSAEEMLKKIEIYLKSTE